MMWVPGWEVLGGQYAMSFVQPYKWVQNKTTYTAGGSDKSNVDGFRRKGSKVMYVLAGPMVAYNIGPVSVSGRFLFNAATENDMDVSFFHLGVSVVYADVEGSLA